MALPQAPSASMTVRMQGAVPDPGVYSFQEGNTLADVIKMTLPDGLSFLPNQLSLTHKLCNAEILTFVMHQGGGVAIHRSEMRARERILLNIPLEPNRMDVSDWEALPGIGPKLARDIVFDRQKNGEFASVVSVLRVPGFGDVKLQKVLPYFQSR